MGNKLTKKGRKNQKHIKLITQRDNSPVHERNLQRNTIIIPRDRYNDEDFDPRLSFPPPTLMKQQVEDNPNSCCLCYDALDNDTVTTEEDNKYHASCIENYVSNNLKSGNLNLTCCKSGTPFSQNFIREAASEQLFGKYLQFQLEQYLKLGDNVV